MVAAIGFTASTRRMFRGCTDLYSKGAFVADGGFDPNFERKQCGGVAMLKGLISAGAISCTPIGPAAGYLGALSRRTEFGRSIASPATP